MELRSICSAHCLWHGRQQWFRPKLYKFDSPDKTRYVAGMAKAKFTHGTRYGYISNCRCTKCVQANRDYQRAWMKAAYHRRRAEKQKPKKHGTLNAYSHYGRAKEHNALRLIERGMDADAIRHWPDHKKPFVYFW